MAPPCDQEPEEKGLAHIFSQKWVFDLIFGFFMVFSLDFWRILPKNEDLEPFLRPDLGGKLGGEPQLKSYINQRFLTVQGGSE
jgi:hypothetical protein